MGGYDITAYYFLFFVYGRNMVPGAGLEPAQPYSRGILKT